MKFTNTIALLVILFVCGLFMAILALWTKFAMTLVDPDNVGLGFLVAMSPFLIVMLLGALYLDVKGKSI